MQVQVIPVARAEEPRLGALFELYTYDFSDLLGLDLGDDERFAVPSFVAYWDEPRRHAFVVRVDEPWPGSVARGDDRQHSRSAGP